MISSPPAPCLLRSCRRLFDLRTPISVSIYNIARLPFILSTTAYPAISIQNMVIVNCDGCTSRMTCCLARPTYCDRPHPMSSLIPNHSYAYHNTAPYASSTNATYSMQMIKPHLPGQMTSGYTSHSHPDRPQSISTLSLHAMHRAANVHNLYSLQDMYTFRTRFAYLYQSI